MAASSVAAKLKLGKRAAAAPAEPPVGKRQATLSFKPGDSVFGNFKGLGDWDEALVVGMHADGTYTLEYTDEGLVEERVPASCVRAADGAPVSPPPGLGAPPAPPPGLSLTSSATAAPGFKPGDSVFGNFKGMGDWDEALVVGMHADGTYTLEYTDEGLVEERVPASCVRAADGAAASAEEATVTYALGESVLGNFKDVGDWDEAVVVGVHADDTYTLEYTDEGLVEQHVPACRIMRAGGGDALSTAAQHGWMAVPDEVVADSTAAVSTDAAAAAEAAEAAEAAAAAQGGGSTGATAVQGWGLKPPLEARAGEEGEGESEYESDDDEPEDPDAVFFARNKWIGPRPGYCFKLDKQGLGYYKDEPYHVTVEREEKAKMQISAPTLANWFFELLQAPPALQKADRFFDLFKLEQLRVSALAASASAGGPLFDSLSQWFDAYKRLLAAGVSPGQLQVTQRVFLEPQQSVRLGMQHVTFSIDWVQVVGCPIEPLSLGLLRKMGMADRKPKRMLMVVMFRAERNQITNVWVELDKEGLGNKKDLTLEDVLLSDAFDRCLTVARKAGAIGELDPQRHSMAKRPPGSATAYYCGARPPARHASAQRFNNYWSIPTFGM